MNRQEKQNAVAQVQKDLQASSAFFVVGVKSLTVREMLALRTALRAENARMQVVKNTLSLRALSTMENAKEMESALRNQVALIFAQADPAGVAREICNYAKKCERLTIVAGSLGSRSMSEEMVRFLGTLPSREVVIAQACGALKAPIASHVGLLRQLMVRFLLVLQRIKAEESV